MVKKEKVEMKVETVKEVLPIEEDIGVYCVLKKSTGEAVCYISDEETFKKAAATAPRRITFEINPELSLKAKMDDYCRLTFPEAVKKKEVEGEKSE